jgi:hypothetical protein
MHIFSAERLNSAAVLQTMQGNDHGFVDFFCGGILPDPVLEFLSGSMVNG